MLILWEHFKTKIRKISPLERMLHCVKIDKFKKMTLYIHAIGMKIGVYSLKMHPHYNLFFRTDSLFLCDYIAILYTNCMQKRPTHGAFLYRIRSSRELF